MPPGHIRMGAVCITNAMKVQSHDAGEEGGGWGGNSQADVDLEGVVDAPLEAGEGADHDDAQGKAACEERIHAHVLDDVAHGGALHGVQLAHLQPNACADAGQQLQCTKSRGRASHRGRNSVRAAGYICDRVLHVTDKRRR